MAGADLIEIPEIEAGKQRLMKQRPGFHRGGRPAAEEAPAFFHFAGRWRAPQRLPEGVDDAIFVAAGEGHAVLGGMAGLLHDERMIEQIERLWSDGAHVALAHRGIDVAKVEGLEKLQPLVAERRRVNTAPAVG